MNTLFVLDASGDVKIEWDPNDAESVGRARQEVLDLKAAGFSFFLVDGAPADEVAAGMVGGRLNCRRVDAEELVSDPEPDIAQASPEVAPETPRRRGRPRSTETVAVATQPLRGG